MGQPFLGEVKLITWNFAPKNWALCNGQLLPINQNQALFSLLQTFYGGDGRVTFGLPDLRGRTAIHQGAGFTIGQKGGEEFHTLIQNEMPTAFAPDERHQPATAPCRFRPARFSAPPARSPIMARPIWWRWTLLRSPAWAAASRMRTGSRFS